MTSDRGTGTVGVRSAGRELHGILPVDMHCLADNRIRRIHRGIVAAVARNAFFADMSVVPPSELAWISADIVA